MVLMVCRPSPPMKIDEAEDDDERSDAWERTLSREDFETAVTILQIRPKSPMQLILGAAVA